MAGHADEYYAEESFGGAQATSKVYTGPFLGVGFSSILGCFAMASITKVTVHQLTRHSN